MEFTIQDYQTGDETRIVEFLEYAFDGWPKIDLECTSLEHWQWKYLDNPQKELREITLALDDQKIIATSHTCPRIVRIGEKRYLSTFGCDVAVHPDYRRMGVNTRMREYRHVLHRKIGFDIGYGMSGNQFLIKSAKRRKLNQFPHPLKHYGLIFNIDQHMKHSNSKNHSLKKYGYHFYDILNKMKNIVRQKPKENPDFNIIDIQKFDDKYNSLWSMVQDHFGFIIDRNREYLNWRYCDPRAGKYIIKQLVDRGEVQGYIVLRINNYQKEYPIGYIVDLFTFPERPDVANALLSESVEFFKANSINVVNYLIVKNHPYNNVLLDKGFVDFRYNPYHTYRRWKENINLDEFINSPASKIHFQFGDIDAI
jgi:GNAT superfamily N-acetyltransferase